MRFFKRYAAILGLALTALATPAAADLVNHRNIQGLKPNHTAISQSNTQIGRDRNTGRKVEIAIVVFERPNGSRYSVRAWCYSNGECGYTASTKRELRGPTSRPPVVIEPHGDGQVALKPHYNTNDRYLSQRAYSRHGRFEYAWVKFATRNGHVYEVYTRCRYNTAECTNQDLRDIGYDRRYDRNHSGRNRRHQDPECQLLEGFGDLLDEETGSSIFGDLLPEVSDKCR